MGKPKIKISKGKLKHLYLNENLSPIQIARKCNCSERTIYKRLSEYNISVKYENIRTDITEDILEKLYVGKKLSIGKIAKMFKCGKNTIWARLCQYNIGTRTKSEANKGKYKIKIPEEEIKSLYINDKLSISEIAKRFNCCCKSISQRLHDLNVVTGIRKIEIPKKELEDLYIKNKMTIYQIGKKFGCNGVTILNKLNQYSIPIWRNELRKCKYRIEVPKEEVKNLYIGKKTPVSKIKKIFNCSATTLRKRLERYGISIRNISEALKGNPSPMKGKHHTEETRKKLSMLTVKQLASGMMKRKDTSIEIKIEKELKRNHIYFQKHVPLCGITVPDFYLLDYKIAIYIDGDYWHNLPVVKNRDEKQNRILKQKGYQVLRFWEHEINRSVGECVNKVKEYIKF